MNDKDYHPVACFGEMLWDFLPAGKEPGGAPMNVAYHLQKLGKNPAVISRVGSDPLADELLGILQSKNICTDYVQRDGSLPTGTVYARPGANNEVVYDIVQGVAWDNIQYEDALAQMVGKADYLVFGSLAARSEQTRETLLQLLEVARTKVLDINLRPPFYSKELAEQLMSHANILKLNQAELELITGWYTSSGSESDRIALLRDRFDLEIVIVTKGANGAVLSIDGDIYSHKGYPVTVADTVGSGDSFLAAIIAQLIDGAPHSSLLEFANRLAALISTHKGACPEYEIASLKMQPFIENE